VDYHMRICTFRVFFITETSFRTLNQTRSEVRRPCLSINSNKTTFNREENSINYRKPSLMKSLTTFWLKL